MLIHEFDELMEARPFVPFEMTTADGRSVRVRSTEFAWRAPAARTVFIASGKGDDVVRIVDLHYVPQFVRGFKPGRNGNRRRRQS